MPSILPTTKSSSSATNHPSQATPTATQGHVNPLDLWPETLGSTRAKKMFQAVVGSTAPTLTGADHVLLVALAELGGAASYSKLTSSAAELYRREFPYTFYYYAGIDTTPQFVVPADWPSTIQQCIARQLLRVELTDPPQVGFLTNDTSIPGRIALGQPFLDRVHAYQKAEKVKD